MSQNAVIFFDGVCNLCNSAVQFVIRHDQKDHFSFSPLQGEFASAILPEFDIIPYKLNSILLLDEGRLYTKSSAALRITKKLSGLWPLLYGLIVIPKVIRDWFYDIIAKNRYKWWGKQESCWLPMPALKNKFIP
ncbi:thiol-disulfide oxidoreductase DCC family protein [Pedobacter sp.]|uniref:thiol-disulfide oxidoreductase DCC family protein n=1 Tax=Pedobacter sp. TaxID=1411316 RepID=UPI003BAD8A8A